MEKILEIRKMTWDEHKRFVKDCLRKIDNKNDNADDNDYIIAEWILENIYKKAVLDDFTPKEILIISARTIECTVAVRENEIKNLKPSFAGNSKETVIA